MKIRTINIDNFKGIEKLHKDIDGNVIYVTGKNGAGKTSILEAIYYALSKSKLPEKPIKEGEDKAVIKLTLAGKDVELEITRSITQKSNTLTVKENGKKVSNGRDLLDGLLSEISVDPFKFMSMTEKEQVELMTRVCGIEFDFEKFDKTLSAAIEERKALKRSINDLKASHDSIDIPDDVPEQSYDIVELNAELQKATVHNITVQRKIDARNQAIARLDELRAEAKKLSQIAKEEFSEDLEDVDDISNKIKIATQYSKVATDTTRKKQYGDDLKKKQSELKSKEKEIKDIEKGKSDAMKAFDSPVEGLSTDGKKLYIGEAPYSQGSSAERIEVAAKLSMLAAKDVKVINIKDASLLDDDMIKTITKVASDNDCQVFLEVVNNKEEIELVFEEAGHTQISSRDVGEFTGMNEIIDEGFNAVFSESTKKEAPAVKEEDPLPEPEELIQEDDDDDFDFDFDDF